MQNDAMPPFCFGWPFGTGPCARLRNRLGFRLLSRVASPIFKLVNARRREWGLKPYARSTDALSPLAQIAQLPEALEFPIPNRPPCLHYVGPLVDERVRQPVPFPWEKLDDRPLVYGSMGTIQNGSEYIFKAIAEACSTLDCQLVLSMGGSREPSEIGQLAGDPIVVRYAPQLELVKRASAVVTHAGLNTTLESLAEGVPLVAIPQGNDQPGVAARIAHHGAGAVVPLGKLSAPRLRSAIDAVLTDETYHAAARRIQAAIRETDAVEAAANVIESAFGLRAASHDAREATQPA